jgi:hypothetical protein
LKNNGVKVQNIKKTLSKINPSNGYGISAKYLKWALRKINFENYGAPPEVLVHMDIAKSLQEQTVGGVDGLRLMPNLRCT